MNKIISSFGLTYEQERILFSLEYLMTKIDAQAPENLLAVYNPFKAKHINKMAWVNQYEKNINAFMAQSYEKYAEEPLTIMRDANDIKRAIHEENLKTNNNTWKQLILLECALFSPYYPMDEDDLKNKTYKGLSIDKNLKNKSLEVFCGWLNTNTSFIYAVQKKYAEALKKLNGYYTKVLIGLAAGITAGVLAIVTMGGSIAALFAASGLYGAAAVSSGLAALGGGAIAAGGFGMVGGMAVLVGGGVLIGGGGGATVAMTLASTNPSGILNETAKLFVVLKEIILGIHHDTQKAQEIISSVIDQMSEYKKEIIRLKESEKENKEKIKNLEKSIQYLERFMGMSK